MLLTIPAYAIMCRLIYRSFNKYNIAEHLIINTFLISQSIVVMAVWLLILILVKPGSMVFEILYISAFSSLILYQVVVFSVFLMTGKLFYAGLKRQQPYLLDLV